MFITVPGSETSALIEDLSPSSSYQVFVNAATSAGFGESSSNLVIAQSKLSTVLPIKIIFSPYKILVILMINHSISVFASCQNIYALYCILGKKVSLKSQKGNNDPLELVKR